MAKNKYDYSHNTTTADTVIIDAKGVLRDLHGGAYRGLVFPVDAISYEANFCLRCKDDEQLVAAMRRHKFALWQAGKWRVSFDARKSIESAMQPRREYVKISPSAREVYGYAAHISDH